MFDRFRSGSRQVAGSRARTGATPPPAIRALEARFVFDGAAAPAAAQAHADSAAQSHSDPTHADPAHAEPAAPPPQREDSDAPAAAWMPATETASAGGRHEIVVVDRSVADLQTLLAGVPASAEVILIDAGRDGFDQLAAALDGRTGIDAIHILSHGSAGDLRLGTGSLTADGITGRYAADLAAIGRALSVDGDLLIYGCDFAAGETGARAAAMLARATGADVAASDDATGDAAMGGDWDLEVHDGAIETGVVVSEAAQHAWHHVLAAATITISGDPVVKDGAGTTISTPRTSNGVDYLDVNANVVGATAFWASAGTVGGVNVSLRATVVAVGESDDAVSFATSASGGDATVLVRAQQTTSPAANLAGSVTIRWDLVRADDPSVAVVADIDFQIGDIDGVGGQPNTRESVTPSQTGLTSYTLGAPTDLVVDTSNDRVRVSGTQNETASPPVSVSIVRFDWSNTSTWQVTYDLAANATTGQAAFQHDGDRSLAFVAGTTKTIPKVDLDADDSSGATGYDYRTTYTEKGAAAAITDTDPLVSNTAPTVSSATVTLTNAQAGDRLNVGTLPGGITAVPSSGSGTLIVTLSGDATPAAYQAALRAITFDTTSADPSTVDRIVRTHLTSDGVQGTDATATISVVAVDDAPVNTLPAGQSVAEDASLVFSSSGSNAITVADADAQGGNLTTTLGVLHGTLTLGSTGGVVVSGNGTGSLTLTGTASAINTALDGTTYRPAGDYNGADTLTVTTGDNGNTGSGGPQSDTDTLALTVTPVNDAPVNGLPASQTLDEDTTLVFSTGKGNAVTVSDIDAGSGSVTATLGVLHGTLTTGGTTNVIVSGSGTGTLTITGTVADVNLALNGAAYRPDADYNGADTLTLTTNDTGNTGSGGAKSDTDSLALTVRPVADPPSNTAPATTQAATEDTTLVFSTAMGNPVRVTDPDGGALTVTLSSAQGRLSLSQLTGLTFLAGDGADDATMTFSGAQADLNAALDGLRFAPDADYNGSAQITLVTEDPSRAAENFTNGGFESPGYGAGSFNIVDQSTVPGWRTTASDQKIEIWNSGHNGVTAYEGSQFAEINANEVAALYQDFGATAGSTISLAFAHRGRLGTDVMEVKVTDLGADGIAGTSDDQVLFDKSYADGNAAWGAYNETLAGTASGNKLRFEFGSVSAAGGSPSVGNFVDGVQISQAFRVPSTITLAIAPVADIVPDSVATDEDKSVAFNALTGTNGASADNFEDPAAAVSSVTQGAHGSVAFQSDGTMTYTPDANFFGSDSFTYTVTSGGTTETATVSVTVRPVNDAPVLDLDASAAGSGYAGSYTEAGAGAAVVNSDVSVADVDNTTMASARAVVSNGSAGDTLSVVGPLSGGITATYDPTSYTLTLSGTATRADYQDALRQVRFTSTAQDPVTTTRSIAVSVNDGAANSNIATATISVVAVDDAPVNTLPAGQSVAEDASLVFSSSGSNAITVADADAQGGNLTTTLGVLHGTLTLGSTGGVTVSGNGTGSLTLTGTASAINTALDGTTYRPAGDYNGADTLTVTTGDNGNTGSGGAKSDTDTLALTVTPVNDAPVNGLPASQTLDEDTTLVFSTGKGNAVTVSDIDAGSGSVTATLGVLHGTLTTGGTTNVTVSGSGTGTLTITGTVADVNLALNGAAYRPDADYNGADTLTVTTGDNGNTGSGGAKSDTDSLALTVRPVNDAPRPLGALPALGSLDGAVVPGVDLGRIFSDVEGDALRFSASGLPAGLSIDPATGLVSGTVDRSASRGGANGDYAVIITADDGHGGLTQARFTWRVIDPAPIARDDGVVVDAATPAAGSVFADNGNGPDSDPDGDPLAVSAVNGAAGNLGQPVSGSAGGRFTVLANGSYSFDPGADFTDLAAGQSRTTRIGYTLSDGEGGTAQASLIVTVTGRNEAPAALQPGDRAASDGEPVALPLGSLFSDPDGEALGFSATGLPPGLGIDRATGALTGTIDHAASGPAGLKDYAVTVTATDPQGATATLSFTFRVTNPAPRAADDAATMAEGGTATIDVLANDTDPDGDPLAIVATGDAAPSAGHGRVAVVNGRLAYTPDAHFNGTDTITYAVTDGNGGISTATVMVTVGPVNDAPDAGTLPDQSGRDGASVRYDVSSRFHDADTDPSVVQAPSGDRLSFSATGLPPGLTIDPATGVISGTLPSDASVASRYAVTVTATDAAGASVARGFTWTVSDGAPTALPDTATTREGSTVLVSVLANDADADGDAIRLVDEPGAATAAHGSVAVDPATGLLTYTPAAGFSGTDTVVYTIADAQGARATGILTVTVTPVNDRPVAAATLPGRNGADGDSVRVPLAPLFSDPDGDSLAYAVTGLPPGLVLDPATGEITGTIDRAASGLAGSRTYVVTLTATDPAGLAASRSFAWTVTNPGPTAVDDAMTTAEDTPVDIDVTSNDTDPDGDPLAVVPGSASAGHGSVALNPDGSLRYTPDRDFNGTDRIVYTVSDGNGGFASAFVTITVTPVNDAPTVDPTSPDLADVAASDAQDLSIAAGRAFGDIDAGDRLRFSATGLPPGLSVDPVTGLISGRLASDASTRVSGGAYTITLTATDSGGATATARLTITVSNPDPVAGDDDISLAEDTVYTGSVLGNDHDPDGDALSVDPVPVVGPTHGRLDLRRDGSFTYVPDADFHGSDSFTYTLVDSDGGRSTATVRLTVDSVNDVPAATAEVVSTREDTPADGRVVASDPDGDRLIYTVETPPASGDLVLRPDGSFTYTPRPDVNGRDSFVIRVSDGQGGSVLVTVPVTIAPVNDAPEGHADPLTLPANTTGSGRIVAQDRDGDPLSYALASGPTNGSLALNRDGSYAYTPYAAYSGSDRFVVSVDDGHGGRVLVSVEITVTPNPVHVAVPPVPPTLIPSRAFIDLAPAAPPPAPAPSIAANGFVLPAMAAIAPLGSVGRTILADGAVVAAVNGVGSLHGTAILADRPAILGESARIAHLAWERFEETPATDTPWFSPRPYLGRSLAFSLGADAFGPGSGDVMLEAVRRPQTLDISLRAYAAAAAGIASVRIAGLDGAPAPAWIEGDGRGSFWGRPPAGTGLVAFELEIMLEDGRVLRRPLTVDAETGQINPLPDAPATERPAAEAPLFSRQLAALGLRGSQDIALIEQALTRAQ